MGRSIVANVPGRFLAGHAFSIDRTRVPLSSIRRAGAIGETASHARLRDGSSQFERCRLYLAARCGSCTDASFGAVFRYPLLRPHAALPDERSFPLSSSGGAPGVLRTLRRFDPASRVVDTVQAPRLTALATFLSDRAHVSFVPVRPLPINFRRDDRVPAIAWRKDGFDFWASTPDCGPTCDHRGHTPILPWASPLAGLSGTLPCTRLSHAVRCRTFGGSSASGNPRPAPFFGGRTFPIRSWV
jgi:hypothetical protein